MKNKIIAFLKKSNKSKKGITLVEVLVALAITSIVVAGVTSGLSFSYNTILKDGMVDICCTRYDGYNCTFYAKTKRKQYR